MGIVKRCGHPHVQGDCAECVHSVRAALKAAERALHEHLKNKPTHVRITIARGKK